ncbi:hypothetical protein BDZ45DRAFT_784320 [Acephala macrosclerotiorum]|nr:hypothetical protein BDZ45DRAFT_784320 [Acephala macrosclerotiorum]
MASVCLETNTEVFTRLSTTFPTQLPRIPDGETGDRFNFPINCHYDDVALASYIEFCHLRDEGIIQKGVRFQVCLPTPVNVLSGLVLPKHQVQVEPFYEKALFMPGKEGVIERAIRVMKSIDKDVPMGVHLRYGDSGHKHFIEPKDLGLLVVLANKISAGIGRNFDWIHMPVPKESQMGDGAELVLGLVHAWDVEGTEKRIDVARKFVKDFAIATECDMGGRRGISPTMYWKLWLP